MVDCGFSYKEVTERLKRLDLDPDALAAIIVTHEHSDHVSGVEALSTRHAIPVYASRGTWIEIDANKYKFINHIDGLFSIGDIVSYHTTPSNRVSVNDIWFTICFFILQILSVTS